ncbi:MAG: 4-hydroxy-3-methylbut-2-enyl diphosphate reductase [Dehalococcoidia bacterium]
MEIILARDMGFCWGVRRAITVMEKAAEEKGAIRSLGPIVHNRQAVGQLEEKGVQMISGTEEIDGAPVAITAHGVGPQVLEELRARNLDVVDTTCPIVTRSQRWAKKLAENGFAVIIFGDANHREVKGVISWAKGKGIAVSEDDLDSLPDDLPSRIGVISQTTQNPDRFAAFVGRLLEKRIGHVSELRVVNTLCHATSSQQAAAAELAEQVDVMVVVGSRHSANTKHLVEVCEAEGTTTYHIETADEIQPQWFLGCPRVGITAGASTPDFAVQAVVNRISELVGG